jgi:hypothetical protein
MTSELADIALWQHKTASLIRSGLLTQVEIIAGSGLFTIVGVYGDGTRSAAMAKYANRRRAEDALLVVARLVAASPRADDK